MEIHAKVLFGDFVFRFWTERYPRDVLLNKIWKKDLRFWHCRSQNGKDEWRTRIVKINLGQLKIYRWNRKKEFCLLRLWCIAGLAEFAALHWTAKGRRERNKSESSSWKFERKNERKAAMLTMHKRVTGKTFAGANTQKETIKYLFRHSSDCFPFSAFYAFLYVCRFLFSRAQFEPGEWRERRVGWGVVGVRPLLTF